MRLKQANFVLVLSASLICATSGCRSTDNSPPALSSASPSPQAYAYPESSYPTTVQSSLTASAQDSSAYPQATAGAASYGATPQGMPVNGAATYGYGSQTKAGLPYSAESSRLAPSMEGRSIPAYSLSEGPGSAYGSKDTSYISGSSSGCSGGCSH